MGKGSSSSKSTNTTNNTNSTVAVDGANTGLVLSNVSGSTITMTDEGAIKSAMSLAEKTIGLQKSTLTETYQAINDNLKQSLAFVDEQNKPDGGLTKDILTPLAYGSAAIAIAYIALRAKG